MPGSDVRLCFYIAWNVKGRYNEEKGLVHTPLLKAIMEEYRGVYQLHLLTDNTEKTVAFYKSLGFVMDTDNNCRAFSKYYIV